MAINKKITRVWVRSKDSLCTPSSPTTSSATWSVSAATWWLRAILSEPRFRLSVPCNSRDRWAFSNLCNNHITIHLPGCQHWSELLAEETQTMTYYLLCAEIHPFSLSLWQLQKIHQYNRCNMPEIHPHQKTQTVAVLHQSAVSLNVSEQTANKVYKMRVSIIKQIIHLSTVVLWSRNQCLETKVQGNQGNRQWWHLQYQAISVLQALCIDILNLD